MDNEQIVLAGGTRAKLAESFAAKTAAFILLVVFTCAAVLSIMGVCFVVADDYYTRKPEDIKKEMLGSFVWGDMVNICEAIASDGPAGYQPEQTIGQTNLTCQVYGLTGKVFDNREMNAPTYVYEESGIYTSKHDYSYSYKAYINLDFPVADKYALTASVVDVLYTLRFWIYVVTLVFAGTSLALFVFLMRAVGHKRGREGVSGSFITKIPFDLLTAAAIFACYLAIAGASELSYSISDETTLVLFTVSLIFCFCLLVGLCVSFAVRVKLGKWWRNTIIYMVLHLIWRILKAMGRAIAAAFSYLPLIWKTVLGLIALGFLSLFCIIPEYGGMRLTMLFFVGLVVAAAVIYIAITLRKLQAAGRKIAAGDLSYRIDTSKMHGDFKEHGENLNSIGLGMTKAVDERMKSERLKTELITNVSHDIKTPLTSIINYVDLISKEKSGNKKIDEYVKVLSRQSERLKKLIEDLVEASKASTGNVDVSLAPCDAGVLIGQSAGEYEEKLRASSLEAIVTAPEKPLMIMADGRLLWRVFDNLMNNVCKYAQPDTRFYISAEQEGKAAVISLKNISKYPLNIKAEELMERFVRGDSSRSTEGSGLGLSIAKSLTELMGGDFALTVDGDLFKVSLSFPAVS